MGKNIKKRYSSVINITHAEHIEIVRDIFATITRKYDFLNHFLSLGQDAVWRRFAARQVRFSKTIRFLDIGTGTADLAIAVARKHPHAKLTGLDFVQEMIRTGHEKIEKHNMSDQISLLQSDALNLPFPSDSFDAAGIAFGIRNIADRIQALKEMKRVLVQEGQVLVLELNLPRQKLFRGLYHIYLNHMLPHMAHYFSRNPAAYYYLADSIMHFPQPGEFALIMEEAGFVHIKKHSLTLGITYLYEGLKPA